MQPAINLQVLWLKIGGQVYIGQAGRDICTELQHRVVDFLTAGGKKTCTLNLDAQSGKEQGLL